MRVCCGAKWVPVCPKLYFSMRIAAMSESSTASSSMTNGESAGIDAAEITLIVTVLLLFAGLGSGFELETVAVFETGPGVVGKVTTRTIVGEPPLMTVPRSQVTVVVPLHVP